MNAIKALIPDYAKDLSLNLDSVLTEAGAPGLSVKQIAAIALSSAIAARNTVLTREVSAFAAQSLNETERNGAKSAAAIMAMNNIYYRFTHLVSDAEYAKLPARLRMNVMANPGIDKIDFELCSIAVSAIKGCGMCVDSHEKTLRQHGVSLQTVQSAVRIASVLQAVAVTIEQAEAADAAPLSEAA
jgi:alkyl hydroperoxide reductase subunit D